MLATVDLPEPDSPTMAMWCPLDGEAHVVDGLEHLLLAGSLNSLVRWSTVMMASPFFERNPRRPRAP